jgi:hypothetical protein
MPTNNQAHQNLVRELLLKLNSLQIGRFWNNPRGVAMTRSGTVMEFGVPGQGDISGILIGGYRAEIEGKTGSGRLSKEQIAFKNMIFIWGGIYIEARNIEDTVQALHSFLQNKKLGSA